MPQFRVRGSGHLIVDPPLVQEVLASRLFIRPPFFRKAFGEGLLLAEGERWSLARKTIQPMLSAKRVQDHAPVIAMCVDELAEQWTIAAGKNETVELVADIAALVLRITTRTLLGHDLGMDFSRARSIVRLTAASNQLAGLGVFDPKAMVNPALMLSLRDERAAVESLAEELLSIRTGSSPAASDVDDLLGRLLAPTFIDAPVAEGGCPIGKAGLVDELVLLLLASVETTTASTGNAIELLTANPRALAAMREESARAEAENPYRLACFRETLRLRPPVWFNGRCATEALTLSSGDAIASGDHVYLCPYLMHRDANVFDNVESFQPERFIGPSAVREGPSYMPFGLGRHYCVGAGLATSIAMQILGTLVARFDIEILENPTHGPDGGFLLGPEFASRARLWPTAATEST